MKTTYFLLTLFIILTSYGIQAGVQYQNFFCVFYDCRYMISTTYTGTRSSTSKKILKTTYDNSKGKIPFENTYDYSETTSRTTSASATVGANILGIEIGASLGGSTSYSITQNYNFHVNIPAGKIGRVYLSEKTEVATFRHVIQTQTKAWGEPESKYKNEKGSVRTEFTTVTTKSPVFSLETN